MYSAVRVPWTCGGSFGAWAGWFSTRSRRWPAWRGRIFLLVSV